MLDFVPTNLQHLIYLGELLHIVAVVLQGQLGSLQAETDAEVPSTFSDVLGWLSCKPLLAQRLVFYPVLPAFAMDFYCKEFLAFVFAFAQHDFDVSVGSFAMFEAEVRLPIFVFFVIRLVFTI